MKKLRAFLLSVLLIVLCLCFLAGCNSYNAFWDSHANKCISQEFMDNNHVLGAYYRNENYDGNDLINNPKYIYDETSPRDRTYIITEEAEFKEIFTKYEGTVDFDKRTVILYMFADGYGGRHYYIDSISLVEDKLIIYYILEDRGNICDFAMPSTRCFMLIMDKTEFDEVEFIETR